MTWTKSKSEICFSIIKIDICEFSLFCEKILEKRFFKNKIHHFHEMKTVKNKKFGIMYGIDMLSTRQNVGKM